MMIIMVVVMIMSISPPLNVSLLSLSTMIMSMTIVKITIITIVSHHPLSECQIDDDHDFDCTLDYHDIANIVMI